MHRALHILTHEPDPLSALLLNPPPGQAEIILETFRLTDPNPDYRLLLEKIFQADSVAVD